MKRIFPVLLVVGAAACGGGGTSQPVSSGAKPPTAGWTTTQGIKAPESVYYDAASGFIFTSQVDGAPDAKDGNGRIVKLNPDGTVANENFVTGLNAPKGVRVCDGTLWIADIGEVIAADASTGAVKSRTSIPDSMFLNDTACAGPMAYVTDMMGNKVYMVMNGTATVVADGDLEFPNGLLVEGDRLIIGGWGSQPKADFTTDVKGHLFAYDMKTKTKTLITPQPTANIDGLESDGKGGYLICDFIAGKLLHVSAKGDVKELRQFKPGSADIGFVPGLNIVLVPHMNDNQVAAYDLSAELK